jgi:nitroreductase
MADNYLGKKLEDYIAGRQSSTTRKGVSLDRLLRKNRSYRGYDATYEVRADQLRKIIEVNTKIPSAMNQQVLRFRPVLKAEADKILPHIRLGGALPELKLPLAGSEPNAFVVVCSTKTGRYVDIDLGISAQSMLLKAVEIGLGGICIAAFDKEAVMKALSLDIEPQLIIAIGRPAEKIELVEITADEPHAYYRSNGVHYVPKVGLDDLILK